MNLYNETGWRDNISVFTTQSAGGITEPAFEDIGNGLYAHGFTNNEALIIQHHIDHDIKVGGQTHMHVHFMPSVAMDAGETVIWTIEYTAARRTRAGVTDSFMNTKSQIVLTYTADGTEIAGQHIVVEDAVGFITPEIDSMIISKVTYSDGSYGSKCFGLTMDLHYEVERNATPNKAYPFYNN